MLKVHIHTEAIDGGGKPPYIETVTCPVDEIPAQLQTLGEVLIHPNAEFGVGDVVTIVIHIVPPTEGL